MRLPDRRERTAVLLWLTLACVVWNGVYDVLMTRGVKEYLLRHAMHEAGRGPAVEIPQVLDAAVRDAVWIATLWASVILLAGLWTVRALHCQKCQNCQDCQN